MNTNLSTKEQRFLRPTFNGNWAVSRTIWKKSVIHYYQRNYHGWSPYVNLFHSLWTTASYIFNGRIFFKYFFNITINYLFHVIFGMHLALTVPVNLLTLINSW